MYLEIPGVRKVQHIFKVGAMQVNLRVACTDRAGHCARHDTQRFRDGPATGHMTLLTSLTLPYVCTFLSVAS